MKKILVSILFIFGFVANAFYQRSFGPNNVSMENGNPFLPPKTTSATPTTPNPESTPPPLPAPRGKFRNGTYTGIASDASYGIVQVQAVITGGALTDIKFLNYPNDRKHSLELSIYSMPILREEAIVAQSANVDTVSGASYTSTAFIESLSSALSQAS